MHHKVDQLYEMLLNTTDIVKYIENLIVCGVYTRHIGFDLRNLENVIGSQRKL